jgi:hypothetical protein
VIAGGYGIALLVVTDPILAGRTAPWQQASLIGWIKLAAAGFVVFAVGYAIFLTTARIAFGSTGISNRTGLVAALGAATVLVATIGL